MYRGRKVNQIMYEIKLKEEWKRRLERQKRREEKDGKGTNKTETGHDKARTI